MQLMNIWLFFITPLFHCSKLF